MSFNSDNLSFWEDHRENSTRSCPLNEGGISIHLVLFAFSVCAQKNLNGNYKIKTSWKGIHS